MSVSGQDVGARLVEERERLGLTRVSFASLVNVHVNTQANYEAGKRVPNTAYLEAAKAVGINIDYVLHGQAASRRELVYLPDNYCSDVLSDYWLLLAYHLEQSMIQGGAVAGQDYGYLDLWKLTQPLVQAQLSQLRLDINDPLGL